LKSNQQETVYDIMDIYHHTVGRATKCWCGKQLKKGENAYMAVLHPNPDGYWLGHKIVCSKDCPKIVPMLSDASVKETEK
jgi:hypothetical protein